MSQHDNFDPDPTSSEVKEQLVQKIITEDGKQKVITVLEQMYPGYGKWIESLRKEQEHLNRKKPKKKHKPMPNVIATSMPSVGPFFCATTDYEITCSGTRKRAHIVSQQVRYLKADTMNILNICEAHEKYFNKQSLKVWYRYVKEHYPQNFVYVKARLAFVIDQIDQFMEVVNE